MRLLPGSIVLVPQFGGARVQQYVVVSNLVRFIVVIDLAAVGRDSEMLLGDRLVLVGIGFQSTKLYLVTFKYDNGFVHS
jgi:hypothetical protein